MFKLVNAIQNVDTFMHWKELCLIGCQMTIANARQICVSNCSRGRESYQFNLNNITAVSAHHGRHEDEPSPSYKLVGNK